MNHNLFISVTTFNRSKIAMQSIADLVEKTQMQFPVFVQDDCSSESEINAQLDNLKNSFINFNVKINEQNYGCEGNNVARLLFAIDIFNYQLDKSEEFIKNCYVYLTDDDMLYSENFAIELKRMCCILQNDESILAATLFNVKNHPVVEEYKYSGVLQTYLVKESFGGCSVLIRLENFIDAMDFYLSNEYKNFGALPGWDWALCTYARKEKKMLISTQNSYVQHIGTTGVNSTPNRFDSADNYV